MLMKKLIFILILIIAILNFLYTFGYQGEPMSQLEFLSRMLVSLTFGLVSIILLNKKKQI
ncbi:MAG: hypothetical protein CNE34_02405 [Rhodothermaeota bacterium MED-G18]|nr:MAG: hypothetical protein CNE34_02405 [Rhodothermaeota bacterium MED-G18]